MGDSTQIHDFAKYNKIFIGKNPSLDTIFVLAILRAVVNGFKSVPVVYTDSSKTSFGEDELMIGGSTLPLNEYSSEGRLTPLLMNCLSLLGLEGDKRYEQLLRYKKAPRLNSPFDFVQIMRHAFNYKSIEETLVFLDFAWEAYLAHQDNFVAQDCNQAHVYEYATRTVVREIATVVSADHETAGALRHNGKTFVVVYNPQTHTVIIQGRRHGVNKQLTPGVNEALFGLNRLLTQGDNPEFSLYRWHFSPEKPQVRGDLTGEAMVFDAMDFLGSIARKLQVIDLEILSNSDVADSEHERRATPRVRGNSRRRQFDDAPEDNSDDGNALGINLFGLLDSLKTEKTPEQTFESDPEFERMIAAAQAIADTDFLRR